MLRNHSLTSLSKKTFVLRYKMNHIKVSAKTDSITWTSGEWVRMERGKKEQLYLSILKVLFPARSPLMERRTCAQSFVLMHYALGLPSISGRMSGSGYPVILLSVSFWSPHYIFSFQADFWQTAVNRRLFCTQRLYQFNSINFWSYCLKKIKKNKNSSSNFQHRRKVPSFLLIIIDFASSCN